MNSYYVTTSSGTRNYSTDLNKLVTRTGDIEVSTQTKYSTLLDEYSFALDGTVLSRLVQAGILPSITYNDTVPFYFVITTVIYDATLGVVTESPFSPEISGKFITFAAQYEEIPTRNRNDIVTTLTQRMITLNNNINITAGSVFRDIIDPVSEEFSD